MKGIKINGEYIRHSPNESEELKNYYMSQFKKYMTKINKKQIINI